MKKSTTLIAGLLSLSILTAKAQDAPKDDKDQLVARGTCECIAKQDLTGKNKQEVQMALGLCMMEMISTNKVDVDIADPEAMNKLGQRVGLKMATICPDFFKTLMGLNEGTTKQDVPPPIPSITGKVKSVKEDTFLFLLIQDERGKEQRVVWLSQFDGSDGFVSDPKALVGKSVTVKYKTADYYAPKAKGYLNVKEIIELKIKE